MSEYSFLIAIAGVLAAGAMSPGPSFFVVARIALSDSRAAGIASAVGTALGVAFFALLASVGVTALLNSKPLIVKALMFAGGCYFLWLSTLIWRGASEPLDALGAGEHINGSMWTRFRQGFVVQVSNPKTAIVIAGVFAAFVPDNAPSLTVPLVVIIAFVIDFSWYAIVATSLSAERSRAIYSSAKLKLDRIAALFLAFVAVRLLMESLA